MKDWEPREEVPIVFEEGTYTKQKEQEEKGLFVVGAEKEGSRRPHRPRRSSNLTKSSIVTRNGLLLAMLTSTFSFSARSAHGSYLIIFMP